MTLSGVCLLSGFIIFAALMALRLLPTLLALPLMAAWVAGVSGISFAGWLNDVLLSGSFRLAAPIVLVVFGAMFARVVQKTGISEAIVRNAAELAGDRPIAIAFLLTATTAFVFLGLSGLGGVIMVGSIALPVMTGAGISPIDAAALVLFGVVVAGAANVASYGTLIGLFGGDAALSYYLPNVAITIVVTVVYILRNIPRGSGDGSLFALVREFFVGLLSVPGSLVRALGAMFSSGPSPLVKKKRSLPAAALIAPILPLIVIAVLRAGVGLGKAADGRIDPVAAAALGFIAASFYAAILTNPRRTVDILAGALVEGIQDVAGVLFLFMGIGMLVAATTHPAAADFLRETLSALLPSSLTGLFLFFALFAPAALYRGPLNLYGMGAGVAALLMGMGTFPAAALCGMFIAVGYIQTLADPTNSHNTWIGGFVGVDTAAILRRVLPYGWAMCLLMLAYAFLLSRG